MTRLGLIVPTTNTVNQAEWQRMAPPGLAFPLARMRLHTDAAALHADLETAIAELAPLEPDVIAYACTAGSLVTPLDTLTDFMEGAAGVPCVATAPAIVEACRFLGVERIALATPYHDALNQHEVDFFSRCGIETLNVKGLGIGAGGPHEYVKIAKVPKDEVYAHCRSTAMPAAQALIVSCTDFPALEAIPRLEAELGKPVISSNLATFWAALRAAGLRQPIAGFGRLLEAQR
ncbi:MAG: maleate cis-trans isomerase family protein [Burkholderiales bacterium]